MPIEIRLIINRKDDAYTARWVESSGQESEPFPLVLPLTAADTSDLRWYLETYYQFPGAGDRVRAEGIERKMEGWGRALFDAVFGTPEGTHVFRNLMDADEPRLLTLGATDPDVLSQPWEMLRDKRGPLAFQGVTLRRQLVGSGTRGARKYDLGLPLRVLLIVSRPADIGFIDPRNSIAPLLDALDALPGQVQVEFCDPPTLARLEEMVFAANEARQPYHIVHFDGHGTYLPLTGVGALAFERENTTTELVPGRDLGDLMAKLGIPLVILEACRSSQLSDKPVFGSVAPALLESGVGSIIAFSHAVHIEAARILVERFYRELCQCRTVGRALEAARRALHANRARWLHRGPSAPTIDLQDWFIPQLYQVGEDPVLVKPASAPKRTTKLKLTIDLEWETFDEKMQRLLTYGIAGFLEIPPNAVQIVATEQGSVKITFEVPEQSAEKLLNAHKQNDLRLVEHLSPLVLLDVTEELARTAESPLSTLHTPLSTFPPPPMYRFHGRAMELLELERTFRRYPALVVSGMGGMGKTALAREAAHWWLRTGRFEMAVFCSFEFGAGAERVVQLLGQALEGERFSSRSSDDQWRAAVDLFHRCRVLLVWDNFESVLPAFQSSTVLQTSEVSRADIYKLYRDLTQSDKLPAGRMLVTCRPADSGLPGLKEMPLGGLARPDSLYLLAAVLDQKSISTGRPGYEREEIAALLSALADHPLSIELVAPHLRELTPEQIRRDYSRLLERFADDTALEGRNKSLLASLEFSRQRLSQAAQDALPYLGWFESGAFEAFILDFAKLSPEVWLPIRNELTATALIQVEELPGFNTPYIRFHPTLPFAARKAPTPLPSPKVGAQAGAGGEGQGEGEGLEGRFIAVYLSVRKMANDALRGHQPAAGMALVAREENNLRAAMARAFDRGNQQQGYAITDTLQLYLERAGRLRERDALTEWVRAQMPDAGAGALDEAACAAIRQHAWTLFTQGHADEAVQQVQALIAQLEKERLAGGADPAFQIAVSYQYLGRIYMVGHRPDLALAPAQKAMAMFEKLPGDTARGNLSAALGDLANAYRQLGQFDAALEAAERALAIERELGRDREMAASLRLTATILVEQQRYAEADARYEEALQAARQAGDLGLQGTALQHQGTLQRDQGHYDRAVELYQQAIALFQRAADSGSEMRTCDLLASAEGARGQLDAAEAWYARSRELALKLNDRHHFVGVARNLGILYQTRAEQTADATKQQALIRQAIQSVQESLEGFIELNDQVNAAASYTQLGILCQMSGDLDRAEENLEKALQIYEPLDHPNVHIVYGNLADIARAHGDADAAARWQAKHDAKVAELEKLRRGGDKETGGQREGQLAQFVLALAQAAYQARASGRRLPPEAAEALAQLEQQAPPPLSLIAPFLRAIAEGQPAPSVPPGLPGELNEILQELVKAVDSPSPQPSPYEGEGAAPSPHRDAEGGGDEGQADITLEQILKLVIAGLQGDTQAGQQAYQIAQALQKPGTPQQYAPLGKGLQRVLEGLRGEEATEGLPEDMAEIVRAVLKDK